MIKKALHISIRQFCKNIKDYEKIDIDPEDTQFSAAKNNLKHIPLQFLEENKSKPRLLPPTDTPQKLTLVFEIDEVLAFTFQPDSQGYMLGPRRVHDEHLWFEQYSALLNIYKRKNLENFINYISQEHQPIIFTKGVKNYVDIMMKVIDPTNKIKHIFTQEHCTHIEVEEEGIDEYVKDLNLLNRDLRKIVYFDCKFTPMWLHPDNCLWMQQFRADYTMKEENLDLFILEIQEIRKFKDVREYLKQTHNMRKSLMMANYL